MTRFSDLILYVPYHDKGPLPPMLMTVLHKISIFIWMSSAYFVCTQMTAP